MDESLDVSRAAAYWDKEHQQPCPDWLGDPLVREYVNGHFDGDWPLHWIAKYLEGRRFARALSIGCGTGSLERFLVEQNVCDRVDAFDASIQSVVTAAREARAAGVGDRVRYFAGDFNTPALPSSTYDAVFFHQSLHHVERLEALLGAVLRTLEPEGLLILDEYVGPSRIDWTRRLLADATRAHQSIDARARAHDELLYPIQADDPSEAIRSGEILEQLSIGFRIGQFRGYGGNILALLYPEVRWQDAEPAVLSRLIDADASAASRQGPYYAVIVATPRSGTGRAIANVRYASGLTWMRYRWRRFVRPLLLRVKLAVRRRLGYDARW